MMSETHPVIARYLTRLDEHLTSLSISGREEILNDIRSHLAEAAADGRSLEQALEALGPAEALARAYSVELMLNPRRVRGAGSPDRLKVAALLVAGTIPALFVVLLLGGVGGILVLGGILAAGAGLVDGFGSLPGWISTAGLPPVVVIAIGAGWILLGFAGLFGLKRFLRFVGGIWRAFLLKPRTPSPEPRFPSRSVPYPLVPSP